MTLGHLGLAILIAGITGASAWKVESIQSMEPGDEVDVGGYMYTFEGTQVGKGPNYSLMTGSFSVRKKNITVIKLNAEKRKYNVSGITTTEAAIHSTLAGDLYAVIGDPVGNNGAFVTRLYFNPLVAWMWIGAIVMMFGGTLSITDLRHRIGIPKQSIKKPARVQV